MPRQTMIIENPFGDCSWGSPTETDTRPSRDRIMGKMVSRNSDWEFVARTFVGRRAEEADGHLAGLHGTNG